MMGLQWAVWNDHIEIVKVILDNVDSKAVSETVSSTLFRHCCLEGKSVLLSILIARLGLIHLIKAQCHLSDIARRGHKSILQIMVDNDIKISKDIACLALTSGHLHLTKFFITHTLSVDPWTKIRWILKAKYGSRILTTDTQTRYPELNIVK